MEVTVDQKLTLMRLALDAMLRTKKDWATLYNIMLKKLSE